MIMQQGTEPELNLGLGWIEGSVEKFNMPELRIPHMGWNEINVINDTYYKAVENKDFYFIHSYHVVPLDPQVIAATVNYGSNVVASIQKDNIFAMQFHPEKSQVSGLTVLKAYFS